MFEGKLPKRKTRIILIEPTEEELKIYNDIRLYITKVYQRALEEGNSATGFVMVSFQKLLASSHFALRKTISKRITTLREHQIKLMQKRAHLEKNPLEIENEKEYKIKMKVLDDQIQVIDEDIPILHDYLERLESLKIDSKALALKDLLEKAREKEGKTKIIVFTQFIRTLLYLKSFLEKSFPDINVTVFHGKLSKDEKNIAVERFKSSNDNITVLISTEAGGEGRNFQFCHNMVNYDLPWNPMKLEQRIGRIDRIGQVYDVNIFNFALKGTVEERVCQLLSERIFTFQEIVGELEPILVDFNDDIEKAIFASNTELGELKFQVLEDKLSQTLQKIHDHRASMQDFIMEMKSKQVLKDDSLTCKLDFSYYDILKDFSLNLVKETRDGKDELISALHETYKYRNAFSFEELKKGIYSIKDDLVEEEYIGTFERKIALSNERLEFFNLGHPFIEKIIDSALNIDVSKKIGIVVTNPKELERSIPNAGASDNKAYFILANSIDKSGVISQKQLLFNVYSLGENGLSEISSVVNPKELLDYMVTCNDIINANFSDRIKDMHKNIVSLIKLNNQRTKTFLSGIEPEWKEANKIYHDKMVAKEKHYHGYQEKKLRDEILQFKFLLNEKKESKKEKDQKAVKTLEGKIKKVKDAISIVKVDHEKRLKEIQETFNRIDITWTLLSIILILPA
ncbi:MAG: helicase-related protein [Candidatus Hodarchaeota archaeon]